jgi:hypothetical protein
MPGLILFYVDGSLVDHLRRDCPALTRRAVERHKVDELGELVVRQRYVTEPGRSIIPICAVCKPPKTRPRSEGFTGLGAGRARWTGSPVVVTAVVR